MEVAYTELRDVICRMVRTVSEKSGRRPDAAVMDCSASYRVAIAPQQGRKVFMLQTILAALSFLA
jgi:hypothetical protein